MDASGDQGFVTAAGLPPELGTARLVLRQWRPTKDLEAFARLNGDPEVMRYIADGRPLDRGGTEQLLARLLDGWAARGFGLYAVEERATGELCGFCGLSVPWWLPAILPAVEIGWRLRRDSWGRGYATESARAVLAASISARVADELVCLVHPDNTRSAGVARKLGFSLDRAVEHPNGYLIDLFRRAL